MIRVLARLLIKDYQNTEDERVRRSYGMLCSVVGIVLNLLLFAGKYAAGVLSASIAITADAFNNLSDAGSSLITLIGFRIAGKRADKGHPFGHRRMEYVSGLMVALIILLMGVEVARDAVGQILHPEAVSASALSVGILLASIGVKLCMAEYNHRYGKRLRGDCVLLRREPGWNLRPGGRLLYFVCRLLRGEGYAQSAAWGSA